VKAFPIVVMVGRTQLKGTHLTTTMTLSRGLGTTHDPNHDHLQRPHPQRPLSTAQHRRPFAIHPSASTSYQSLASSHSTSFTVDHFQNLLNSTKQYLPDINLNHVSPGRCASFNLLSEHNECSICEETLDSDHPPVMVDGCRHVFGRECLARWINLDNAGSNRCPVCRNQLFGEDAAVVQNQRVPKASSESVRPTTRHLDGTALVQRISSMLPRKSGQLQVTLRQVPGHTGVVLGLFQSSGGDGDLLVREPDYSPTRTYTSKLSPLAKAMLVLARLGTGLLMLAATNVTSTAIMGNAVFSLLYPVEMMDIEAVLVRDQTDLAPLPVVDVVTQTMFQSATRVVGTATDSLTIRSNTICSETMLSYVAMRYLLHVGSTIDVVSHTEVTDPLVVRLSTICTIAEAKVSG
jgi:hypothetical protein